MEDENIHAQIVKEELEVLRAEKELYIAEKNKIIKENLDCHNNDNKPIYRKAIFYKVLLVTITALPVFGFYVKEIYIPFIKTENAQLALQLYESQELQIQKQKELEDKNLSFKKYKRTMQSKLKEQENILREELESLAEQNEELSSSIEDAETKAKDIEIKYKKIALEYKTLSRELQFTVQDRKKYKELANQANIELSKLRDKIKNIQTASRETEERTDRIAKQLRNTEENRPVGYICMCNYTPDDKSWSKIRLGKINEMEPINIKPGRVYEVLGNMRIRATLPPNTEEYYRAVDALGVVRKGSMVKILEKPVPIKRKAIIQYWVKIQSVPKT